MGSRGYSAASATESEKDRVIASLQNEIAALQMASARGSSGGMRRAGASSRGSRGASAGAAVGRADAYANAGSQRNGSAGSQRGFNSQRGGQPGFVPPSADRYVLRSADGSLRVPATPSQRRDAAQMQESIAAVRDL